MRGTSARAYRSKLEVLRDFLRAAQAPAPKTRIIGAANLNPASFRRYLQLCTERSLITSVSGGYVTTPRATPVLEAIEGLMVQRGEVDRAFRLLERHAADGPSVLRSDGQPFRHVLREAWTEIVLRPDPRPRAASKLEASPSAPRSRPDAAPSAGRTPRASFPQRSPTVGRKRLARPSADPPRRRTAPAVRRARSRR